MGHTIDLAYTLTFAFEFADDDVADDSGEDND